MKVRVNCATIVTAAAAVCLLCDGGDAIGTIAVMSSNAMRPLLQDVVPQFERASGARVQIEYGVGAQIARRIHAGEPFDVVVLTPSSLDALANAGRIAPASRTLIAQSPIALAGRAGIPQRDTATVDAFRQVILDAPSIAYAEEGVAGVFFVRLLRQWEMQDRLQSRLRPLPTGSAVAASVADGTAGIGVLPLSEIVHAPGVAVLGVVPKSLGGVAVMEAALHPALANQPEARAFLTFLTSSAVTTVLPVHGLERPAGN